MKIFTLTGQTGVVHKVHQSESELISLLTFVTGSKPRRSTGLKVMTAIYLHARSTGSGRGEEVTGMFLTVSSPAAVSLNPRHRRRHQRVPPPPSTPSTQRLTMKPIQRDRKCLPLTGAQSKPPLFPCQIFLQETASQKICQLCRQSGVLLSCRSRLFFCRRPSHPVTHPPFFFFYPPPSPPSFSRCSRR